MSASRHDPERVIDLDLVRCTENAALAAWKHFGKGDKNLADFAASDALRGMFQLIDCRGVVRIGEGRKDDAPGIFAGEKLGSWRDGSIPAAIAVDPIDGTTLTARGLNGAISVLALSTCDAPDGDPTSLFPAIPSHYMEKFAVGPKVADSDVRVQLDAPLEANLSIIAGQLRKRVRDLVVVVLDRPRHETIIENIRNIGCRIRLISDGDVAAAIAPSLPNSGIDAYVGVGGSPEAVISAAAIKCLGGQQLCRMWPKDASERRQLLEAGCQEHDIGRVWTVEMMAPGNHVIFSATGISDSPMLRGIQYAGGHCVTHSVLMRARNRTVRMIEALHDLTRKTIRLYSTGQEMSL
ncbi:MAG: class II fructose-bisphosphatase [Planctomycetota bacterium]|nr:MAG: class II fructose-bisphosphatase [Planctomycetota bacterium]